MKRTLPPLNPLKTFEVAARQGSFTRAAEELHVSQAAVSRQVATLENYLGFKLFRRKNREIQLTEIGMRYAATITRALDQIENATEQLPISQPGVRFLHVRAYSTFAQYWLIPRLHRFFALHPNINLQLRASLDEVDFERDEVQVWIHYGRIHKTDVVVEPFLQDVIQPACTPEFARRLSAPPQLAELSQVPLLQTLHRPQDWPSWLTHVGLGGFNSSRIRIFENSALAYQAALEGLGIVIAQESLVERLLRTKQLVMPFRRPLVRPYSYQLVYRAGGQDTPAVRAFRDWIFTETVAQKKPAKGAPRSTPS